jgi:acetyl-CoA acyltransferase
MSREVVIIEGARTPFGRAQKGNLRQTRPEDLAALAVKEALRRAGLTAEQVEDLALGCAMPEGQQGLNVARNVGFLAGLPDTVPAYTVNRFCASGLQSIADVAARIATGQLESGVGGGLESMTAVPMGGFHPQLHPGLAMDFPQAYIGMGTTAENVAARFGVSREDQDAFAYNSHRKASIAREKGLLAQEIIPVDTFVDGKAVRVEHDELIRPDTTLEGLKGLKPAFKPVGGTVTAGNSSPLTDGAAAVVLGTRDTAGKGAVLGVFKRFVTVGVDPAIMGIGPVPAIRKLLSQSGLTIADIDLFEINEAFAAQSVYCQRELGIPDEKLNVNGGAIALGHPLGVSGSRLVLTAL